MKGYGKNGRWMRGLACTLIGLVCACAAAQWIGDRHTAQELSRVHEQVRRAAVACYAAEGRYPCALSYLEEAYGLCYDSTRYAVYYDAFASNVLPDIQVRALGEE